MITFFIGLSEKTKVISELYNKILKELKDEDFLHLYFYSKEKTLERYSHSLFPFNKEIKNALESHKNITICHNALYAPLFQGNMYALHNAGVPFLFYHIKDQSDFYPSFYCPPQHDYFYKIDYNLWENKNYCEKGHAGLLVLKSLIMSGEINEESGKKVSDIVNSLQP